MKKFLSITLLFILLLNFTVTSFAANTTKNETHPKTYFVGGNGDSEAPNKDEYLVGKDPDNPDDQHGAEASDHSMDDIVNQGEVDEGGGSGGKTVTDHHSFGITAITFITGVLARVLNVLIALQVDLFMAMLTCNEENGRTAFFFTIERVVFNRVPFVDIDYFADADENSTENTYTVGNGSKKVTLEKSPINKKLKQGIAGLYMICRNISLILSVAVLIYIGIRMALSTVASDQARYKKMLVSWIESVVLLFALLYICEAIMAFGKVLTNVFYDLEQDIIAAQPDDIVGKGEIFEDSVRTRALLMVIGQSGYQLTFWSLIYWFLLFTELKFFWLYMKRFLMVGFLIIISPLITITYSIDKVGDGKAQVFSNWMKEFCMNVLIQPLHALLYMVFVITANEIAIYAPVIAIALLFAMGQAERMVKVIFNMKGLASLRGVDKFLKKGK